MQLTGFRKVERPLTVNDFHILALLLQFFIIFHSLLWCCQAELLWNGCGKAKGRFRVRMWPGDTGALVTRELPRGLVFHLFSEKVGLWPPTACCHPQLVYVWPGVRLCQPVPPPGGHCLHASPPTTFLASFSRCFFSNCFLISPL